MIDEGEKGREAFNFEPGAEVDVEVVGNGVAAGGVVLVGHEEADDPREGDVPVEGVLEIDEKIFPVRLREITNLSSKRRMLTLFLIIILWL